MTSWHGKLPLPAAQVMCLQGRPYRMLFINTC